MNLRKALLLGLVVVLVVLFFVFDLGRYFSLEQLKAQQHSIEAYRAGSPVQTALIFAAGYVAVTALSLPGAAVMTVAAGAIFGLVWGTLLVSFASTIGATLAFLSSRYVLGDWVRSRFGEKLKAIDAGMERQGAFYLFTLRLVPLFPFFAVNLLMGLTKIRPLTFFWVSQLGMLAGTVVFVNAGTQLANLESLKGVLSPGLIGSFALIGVLPLLGRAVVRAIVSRKVYARWDKPKHFDRNLIVIGGGSAGLVASYIAAIVRAKVTLVEKHEMGGDCLNTGCVPSKALIRSAKLLSDMHKSKSLGIAEARAQFDFAEVMARVTRVVEAIAPHDSVERYTELGVDVIRGEARLLTPWSVEIDEGGQKRVLTTRAVIIAAGAGPLVPPIPGLQEAGFLTSNDVWGLRELPARLVVLGGGPIGCEFAQAFARFGSKVTQVEMQPRLLGKEDVEVSELIAQRFVEEGVDVRVGHRAVRVEKHGDESVLIAEHDSEEVSIPFDRILVAVGRAANLSGYGAEALGIEADKTVRVNDLLQTNYPNIYAAGDVTGPFQFTHVAAHQAWYATVNALFSPFKTFSVDYSVIPWATFVDPEVARVGLNEEEAREQGIPYEVTRYGIEELDRAIADEQAVGFVKVLTPPGRDRILGVTLVGSHAADVIAEFVLAMRHGIGLNKLLGTIHIYPTMAEANKYAAGVWKKRHAPERLLEWVKRFHDFRRG